MSLPVIHQSESVDFLQYLTNGKQNKGSTYDEAMSILSQYLQYKVYKTIETRTGETITETITITDILTEFKTTIDKLVLNPTDTELIKSFDDFISKVYQKCRKNFKDLTVSSDGAISQDHKSSIKILVKDGSGINQEVSDFFNQAIKKFWDAKIDFEFLKQFFLAQSKIPHFREIVDYQTSQTVSTDQSKDFLEIQKVLKYYSPLTKIITAGNQLYCGFNAVINLLLVSPANKRFKVYQKLGLNREKILELYDKLINESVINYVDENTLEQIKKDLDDLRKITDEVNFLESFDLKVKFQTNDDRSLTPSYHQKLLGIHLQDLYETKLKEDFIDHRKNQLNSTGLANEGIEDLMTSDGYNETDRIHADAVSILLNYVFNLGFDKNFDNQVYDRSESNIIDSLKSKKPSKFLLSNCIFGNKIRMFIYNPDRIHYTAMIPSKMYRAYIEEHKLLQETMDRNSSLKPYVVLETNLPSGTTTVELAPKDPKDQPTAKKESKPSSVSTPRESPEKSKPKVVKSDPDKTPTLTAVPDPKALTSSTDTEFKPTKEGIKNFFSKNDSYKNLEDYKKYLGALFALDYNDIEKRNFPKLTSDDRKSEIEFIKKVDNVPTTLEMVIKKDDVEYKISSTLKKVSENEYNIEINQIKFKENKDKEFQDINKSEDSNIAKLKSLANFFQNFIPGAIKKHEEQKQPKRGRVDLSAENRKSLFSYRYSSKKTDQEKPSDPASSIDKSSHQDQTMAPMDKTTPEIKSSSLDMQQNTGNLMTRFLNIFYRKSRNKLDDKKVTPEKLTPSAEEKTDSIKISIPGKLQAAKTELEPAKPISPAVPDPKALTSSTDTEFKPTKEGIKNFFSKNDSYKNLEDYKKYLGALFALDYNDIEKHSFPKLTSDDKKIEIKFIKKDDNVPTTLEMVIKKDDVEYKISSTLKKVSENEYNIEINQIKFKENKDKEFQDINKSEDSNIAKLKSLANFFQNFISGAIKKHQKKEQDKKSKSAFESLRSCSKLRNTNSLKTPSTSVKKDNKSFISKLLECFTGDKSRD